ncbi:hypothetical protein K438DRAFT_1757771 [Mycena galopus ATCC 62051]|nr:hypothetical protein K438DRAFT_1757771 [Mycena galopus ATCC 62051]
MWDITYSDMSAQHCQGRRRQWAHSVNTKFVTNEKGGGWGRSRGGSGRGRGGVNIGIKNNIVHHTANSDSGVALVGGRMNENGWRAGGMAGRGREQGAVVLTFILHYAANSDSGARECRDRTGRDPMMAFGISTARSSLYKVFGQEFVEVLVDGKKNARNHSCQNT